MAKTGPEHALQVLVNKTVREVVPQPHLFFSVDRTRKQAQFEHVRQKARGLVAGTSDTILLCPNMPAILIELKARGKTVETGGTQERFGETVANTGHLWGWCDTVVGYCRLLREFGVPLHPRWELIAAGRDATLEGAAIKREEARTGVPAKARSYRARSPKPSVAKIRRVEALRREILF